MNKNPEPCDVLTANRSSSAAPESTADRDEARIEALKAEVRQLRGVLGVVQTRQEDLLSSTSWRLTAPIRALKTWLRSPRAIGITRASPPSGMIRPIVPGPLLRVDRESPETSNDSYCLIDAANAMGPIVRAPLGCAKEAAPRIAFLGSAELAAELAFDASVLLVHEATWRSDLSLGRFDYLLIETVWHVGNREWRYSLVGDAGRREDIAALILRCRELSLPVVLWFREDIANYERFAWLARHADLVYAVDDDLCNRLRAEFPDKPVALLPVAIQPALHNPIRSYALQESAPTFADQVLYDGWWDLLSGASQHELLENLRESGLRVCESEWDFGGVRLPDCPEFSPNVLGCVDAIGKTALNKLFAVELFLEHGLRLPWRQRQAMLRAAAGGSLVAQCQERSANPMPAGVCMSGDPAAVEAWLSRARSDGLLRATTAHKIRRELLASHCLADRLARIAADLDIGPGRPAPPPKVAMILVTMRPQLLSGCIERFRAENYPDKELVIVLHGDQDLQAAKGLLRAEDPIRVISVGRERSLGACLNFAISQGEAPFWSKVDDDDCYGPHYLSDLMASRRMIDFDVAGKPPMFAYLEDSDTLYWDPVWAGHAHLLHTSQEARSALIAGGTITGRREVIDEIPFSETRRGGSDSDFIRRCYEAGHDALAADGFNFARFRSGRPGFHTWRQDNGELHDRAVKIGGCADIAERVFV